MFGQITCAPSVCFGRLARNRKVTDKVFARALEDWEEFIDYLRYDVLSEKEIFGKLSRFEFPEEEQRIYAADQRINDYGIGTTMFLINKKKGY